jgi:hypothetical protein
MIEFGKDILCGFCDGLLQRCVILLENTLQIQAEAKQWEQVQQVLKHVSAEMATLQQACMGWEKRALAAEALAATWQREVKAWQYLSDYS